MSNIETPALTDDQATRIVGNELSNMGIETLETRGMDALDCHDVNVAEISDLVAAAYAAGYEAAQRDGATN